MAAATIKTIMAVDRMLVTIIITAMKIKFQYLIDTVMRILVQVLHLHLNTIKFTTKMRL